MLNHVNMLLGKNIYESDSDSDCIMNALGSSTD